MVLKNPSANEAPFVTVSPENQGCAFDSHQYAAFESTGGLSTYMDVSKNTA